MLGLEDELEDEVNSLERSLSKGSAGQPMVVKRVVRQEVQQLVVLEE